MNIQFIRNATLILEIGDERILVDPMPGRTGSLLAYAFIRHKPRKDPTVPLPPNIEQGFGAVTAGLITHCRLGHFDHLDKAGWQRLASPGVPVYCDRLDEKYLRKRGIQTRAVDLGIGSPFLGGSIQPVEATHGYGCIGVLMEPGLGYVISFPGEPTIYISGGTVLRPAVRQVLERNKPDIAILATGAASLDIGKPILMSLSEIHEFMRLSPGVVIATHMEALNHCPVGRKQLLQSLSTEARNKEYIPKDGERLAF